jgi:hypothetical protein
VCQVFVLLTGGASFNVFSDPRPGARPEVFLVYVSDCFVSSRVTVKGAIVPCVHNFAFQALIRGDYEAVCRNISPEWCSRAFYSFDGECVFPFFHEGGVVVLDDSDEMFYGAEGVFVRHTNEEWFGEHDHLLVVVFDHVGTWGS